MEKSYQLFLCCGLGVLATGLVAGAAEYTQYEKLLSRNLTCHVDKSAGNNPARLFINGRECLRPLIPEEGTPAIDGRHDSLIYGCLQYKGENESSLGKRLHINSFDETAYLDHIRGFESSISARCEGSEYVFPASLDLKNYSVVSITQPNGEGTSRLAILKGDSGEISAEIADQAIFRKLDKKYGQVVPEVSIKNGTVIDVKAGAAQ
jgi:hypothetical protein